MAGEDLKNRIVMINSFKGGAGKTTAALCRCVTEYKDKTYHRIYYVDLDILGTGVNYVLSLEKQQVYYNDIGGAKQFGLRQKVQEILNDEEVGFYAAVLNPISRIKQSYEGQDMLRSCPNVERGIFLEKVKELLNQMLSNEGGNLIVLDCAPGITYMEESILATLYDMGKDSLNKVAIEEIYVTTPDASHIRKTIDNLNECGAYFKQHNRTVTVLINDLYDCEGMDRTARDEQDENFHFVKEKVIEKIKKELKIPSAKLLYKRYSAELMRGSIMNNEIKLVNRSDDFYTWPRSDD